VKKFVLALVVAAASVGVASAQTAPKTTAPKAPATSSQTKAAAPAKPSAAKTPAAKPATPSSAKAHTMKAEVVSTDETAKSITVKDSTGANQTLTASGAAVAALAKVKAGDMVTITEHDSTATKIVKAKAHKTAKAPAKK
jgi:hypothetical protein